MMHIPGPRFDADADAASSLVMRASSPLEDRPLEHASGTSSSAHSKLIHTAGEVSELPACPDVKDIEDHGGLLSWVAGVLAAVGDEVLLIGAEVYQANLSTAGRRGCKGGYHEGAGGVHQGGMGGRGCCWNLVRKMGSKWGDQRLRHERGNEGVLRGRHQSDTQALCV